MKFDVVIGNPPYIRGKWTEFFDLFLNLSDRVVASVNPDLATRFSSNGEVFKKKLFNNGLIYHEDATRFFPSVESGRISAFVLDKQAEPIEIRFPPLVQKLLDKTNLLDTARPIRGKYEDESETPTDIPFLSNATKQGLNWKYGKVSAQRYTGRYFIFNRFLGNTPDDPVFLVELNEDSIGGNIIIHPALPNETISGFKSVWCSTFYRRALKELKQGFFDINTNQIRALPRMDYSKIWTDQEIYEHFNLTPEEISYIEEVVG